MIITQVVEYKDLIVIYTILILRLPASMKEFLKDLAMRNIYKAHDDNDDNDL